MLDRLIGPYESFAQRLGCASRKPSTIRSAIRLRTDPFEPKTTLQSITPNRIRDTMGVSDSYECGRDLLIEDPIRAVIVVAFVVFVFDLVRQLAVGGTQFSEFAVMLIRISVVF